MYQAHIERFVSKSLNSLLTLHLYEKKSSGYRQYFYQFPGKKLNFEGFSLDLIKRLVNIEIWG